MNNNQYRCYWYEVGCLIYQYIDRPALLFFHNGVCVFVCMYICNAYLVNMASQEEKLPLISYFAFRYTLLNAKIVLFLMGEIVKTLETISSRKSWPYITCGTVDALHKVHRAFCV